MTPDIKTKSLAHLKPACHVSINPPHTEHAVRTQSTAVRHTQSVDTEHQATWTKARERHEVCIKIGLSLIMHITYEELACKACLLRVLALSISTPHRPPDHSAAELQGQVQPPAPLPLHSGA